jgi:hypothetical protein
MGDPILGHLTNRLGPDLDHHFQHPVPGPGRSLPAWPVTASAATARLPLGKAVQRHHRPPDRIPGPIDLPMQLPRRRPRPAARRSAAAGPGMPAREVPPPKRAVLIMNPRPGGGKVAKFGLKGKAEALGAQMALLEGPGTVDVAALAQQAVADGADLLGVAGGDGTQALVVGIAAEHDPPFLVISAGTATLRPRPRAGPGQSGGLLGCPHRGRGGTADRPGRHRRPDIVNNASFGAYAEVVRSPAYRDDKRRRVRATARPRSGSCSP